MKYVDFHDLVWNIALHPVKSSISVFDEKKDADKESQVTYL